MKTLTEIEDLMYSYERIVEEMTGFCDEKGWSDGSIEARDEYIRKINLLRWVLGRKEYEN